ncbi:MAG: DUF354 domain-containing protein [Halobacteriota archaeon]
MRIGVFINTPGQLHFYRNIVSGLEDNGHDVSILVRKYGEMYDLLDQLGVSYYSYSSNPPSKFRKLLAFPGDLSRAHAYLKSQHVDVVTGFGIYNTLSDRLLRTPDIVFTDSEPMVNSLSYAVQYRVFTHFTDAIITPEAYRQDLGSKHLRVASFKEMAYLHPNYYTPNPDVYDALGVADSDDFVLLRFNAFFAVHDVGVHGFTDEQKVDLVKRLEGTARVFISSEAEVPPALRDYIIPLPKARIHDALYYAKLLVTDTQTMATEAALLGTPTVRSNSFIGDRDMGNFVELEQRYGLLFNYREPYKATEKAVELVLEPDVKQRWKEKRKRLLNETIDITAFMVWFIDQYPDSRIQCAADPDVQYRIT